MSQPDPTVRDCTMYDEEALPQSANINCSFERVAFAIDGSQILERAGRIIVEFILDKPNDNQPKKLQVSLPAMTAVNLAEAITRVMRECFRRIEEDIPLLPGDRT